MRIPVWSTEGAKRVSGHWHEVGTEVIYTSENYSTAMLEKLVHWNGVLPPNQHFIETMIPRGTSYEVATANGIPNWLESNREGARRFGRTWYGTNRSAVLIVPSVVARMERNIIINARHPNYEGFKVGFEKSVWSV